MPRFRRRSSGIRPVIQSFKKVINYAPVSQASGNRPLDITLGVDSLAAGQTGPTDVVCPTGSIVKYFEIQLALGQIVAGSTQVHIAIMQIHSSQTIPGANVIGGSNQRNQVFLQHLYQLGENQTFNRTFKFKVPKSYQRIREGDHWVLQITTDGTLTQTVQIIYKFYR